METGAAHLRAAAGSGIRAAVAHLIAAAEPGMPDVSVESHAGETLSVCPPAADPGMLGVWVESRPLRTINTYPPAVFSLKDQTRPATMPEK